MMMSCTDLCIVYTGGGGALPEKWGVAMCSPEDPLFKPSSLLARPPFFSSQDPILSKILHF